MMEVADPAIDGLVLEMLEELDFCQMMVVGLQEVVRAVVVDVVRMKVVDLM
jgi:hypothetical protein